MKSYWNLQAIPELSDLPKKQRDRVFSSVVWKAFAHWQTWLALIAVVVLFLIGLWVDAALFPAIGLENLSSINLGSSICIILGVAAFSQVIISQTRSYMREYRETNQLSIPMNQD